MKHVLLCLFATLVLGASAQTYERKWNLGLLGGTSEYAGDKGNGFLDFNSTTLRENWYAGLSLTRYLGASVDFTVMGTYGQKWGYYRKTPDFGGEMTLVSAYFKYKFNNGYMLDKESRIQPYILGGAGYMKTSGSQINGGDDFPLIVGAGLNLRISPVVGINYQATMGYLNSDSRDFEISGEFNDAYLQHTIGLNFNFGMQKDADKDGVSDIKDKCANTPMDSKVDKNGCPLDGDGDGVLDYQDLCPQVAGLEATKGCPDMDKDGVADVEDSCPDVAGLTAMKGCPDADGDGIIDSKDKCPNVKGVLELDGCGDRDGDKIKDDEDKCPDKAGLANFGGCPDTDDDGVMDTEDLCPETKGPIATKGCPDSDNDGVTDNIDKCPSTPGTPANAGCPDTDGDGLNDSVDECPNVSGPVSNNGCPELKVAVKQLFEKALQGIQFETGKATIKPVSFPILNAITKVVVDNPTYKLLILGHTDDVGDDAMNMTLSQDRADEVAKYLISKGADPLRVSGKGMGETTPVDSNKSAAGRTRNRRVELKVSYIE